MDSSSNKSHSIAKKAFIYAIGTLSSKMISVIIIPIYAVYISVADLGSFDYQNTIAQFLSPVIFGAIWEAILRMGLGKEKNIQKKVVTNSICFVIANTVILAIFLPIIYRMIFPNLEYYQLFVFQLIFTPILSVFQYIVRALGESKIFVMSGIIAAGINLLLLTIFVVTMGMGILGLLLSIIISNVINLIFLIFRGQIFQYFATSSFDFLFLKSMLKYSIPLTLNLTFGWLIVGFSRFYIGTYIGVTENGIFSFAMKFSSIILTLTSIVSMSMIEDAVITSENDDFIERFVEKNTYIFKMYIRLATLSIPIICCAYSFITNPDYKKSLVLVPILVIMACFSGMTTNIGNIFAVYNKTNQLLMISVVSGLLSVVGTYLLGYSFGVIGVSFATLLGTLVLFGLRYYFGRKIAYYAFDWKRISLLLVLYSAIAFVCIHRGFYFNLFLTIIFSAIFVFTYKQLIITYLKKFFR
ncbi:TPA: lipopolysaccharide biosynthesis protein, partial [Enterococcus faecium]|nr:polysaccharide biosynthesis C-terminal domain-containing protein [Enterococcus faecium]